MKVLLWLKDHLRVQEIPFARWEMLFMRLILAWLLYVHLPGSIPWTQQPRPNGVAQWIDLTWLSHQALYDGLWWGALLAIVLYVLGVVQALALSYLSLLFTAVGTLENSQGAIEHHLQLLVLVLVAQTAVSWWQTAVAWKNGRKYFFLVDVEAERKLVHWTRVLIAGAYLAMAITKIDRSNGRWIWDTPNLSLQIIKTQANDWANTGITPDPFYMETLPQMIADHPHLARLFFSPGLWLELLLILGLLNRGWSLVMGLGGIVLHRSIHVIMSLHFPTHEWLLWAYFVNVPFWVFFGWKLLGNKWPMLHSILPASVRK